MTENLEKLLKAITHKHVYIQTHNFPDPDAIASAYGLQQLLKYFDVEATVCYQGAIERFNTNYIIDKLNIKFSKLVDINEALQGDDEVVDAHVGHRAAGAADVAGVEGSDEDDLDVVESGHFK